MNIDSGGNDTSSSEMIFEVKVGSLQYYCWKVNKFDFLELFEEIHIVWLVDESDIFEELQVCFKVMKQVVKRVSKFKTVEMNCVVR